MARRLVVIGAGMAAGRLLDRLAGRGGWDVTLVNAEPRGSYDRIQLSPVLSGDRSLADIVTHDEAWYAAQRVATRLGTRVVGIDRAARSVRTCAGEVLGYDRLVLATGSEPVVLPLPGAALPGVIAYRDVEDASAMMALPPGARAVVIGGGLLGLEAAAGMAARGVSVTVVHIFGHLMERQLDPEAGAMLARDLAARGIAVRCGAVSSHVVERNGRAAGLALEDGEVLAADLVVMAVGVRPATALAAAAGLAVERGIVVDDAMTTSDPAILAIGECVQHAGRTFGLVAPCFDQAEVAARVLSGERAAFAPRPVPARLKVTGCDLFSMGDFAGGAGRDEIVLRQPGAYRRLVVEDGRLIGAVLYGDASDGAFFQGLLGGDVRHHGDALVFGPAYAVAA